METINLASFLAYLGDYYPVLIPSAALLFGLACIMLDQLRVWVITYVDEGESGPYKRYVIPFLHILMNNSYFEPKEDRVFGQFRFQQGESDTLRIYGNGSVGNRSGDHIRTLPDGTVLHFDYSHTAEKYDDALKIWPDKGTEIFDVMLKGRASVYHYDGTQNKVIKGAVHNEFDTAVRLAVSLVVGGLVLLAYKFLPAITVGTIIGYAVMRLARSVVRLTKRFNKHCSDGHGAEAKAPQEEPKAE